jgi:hypothetical protein
MQELEQQLQSESETAEEQTEHLQSLLDEEKRLKEEANHDVLKTREVYNRLIYMRGTFSHLFFPIVNQSELYFLQRRFRSSRL